MVVTAPSSRISRTAAFWIVGIVFFTLMASSAAPSPLYPVYQQAWGFSSTMLTFVFAVYAFALLGAILTVGSLSDHVGRRPIVISALVLLIVSLAVFALADSVTWLIVARILQGIAAGAATGALTASIVDLQPTAAHGPLLNSVAPSIGLGAGALGAGTLVQFAPFPRVTVFVLLIVVLVVLTAVVALIPESTEPRGFTSRRHVAQTLRPRLSVPSSMRAEFLIVLPCLIATWALGGFHLSLGPSIIGTVFGLHGAVLSGFDIFTLFTAGALGAALLRNVPPRRVMTIGTLVLATGLVGNLVGLATGVATVYFVGSAVSGFGWGAAFLGSMRIVGEVTPADQRGSVFATMFVVNYVAFSVPAIIGGVAVHSIGLVTTGLIYGSVVIALALWSSIALWSAAGAQLAARRTG
ncbi:MFS transporter [Rhodococcoides trifolii]|uniref:MFS transporter n=1 Tax=Rhodococcoides trifolii TaxID=908250 RepID=A0A917CRC3_9NOCA|nr:MFS transporter [Rhodococcus trifolii]GGF96946.1 MFS transporter [Rhodococcus trifolii]